MPARRDDSKPETVQQWTRELDETGIVRLAQLLALKLGAGDVLALTGDLGAGKTTLARALIAAFVDEGSGEVPSPTFSLAQSYATPRLSISHFDFYRLTSAEDARELGFEEAAEKGAVIVEWPERAVGLLPDTRYEVELAETADPGVRRATLRGLSGTGPNVARIGEVMAFLDGQPHWRDAAIRHLQGDASTRSYARLTRDGETALLMDAPHRPDGPPVRDGKPYSRIARLADDDMLRPFVAIGGALSASGLSVPEVIAMDLQKGLALVEDLGDLALGPATAAGFDQAEMWRTAVDVLIHLRGVPMPAALPLPDGTAYSLPRRDRAAFEIEIDLLLDWYWPAAHGSPAPEQVRSEFNALWSPVLDRLLALPGGWFLRDYHSPNLFWLPHRQGLARMGIIDFQDALNEHFAFDLVSLLQDARVTVPEELEARLFAYYCAEIARREPSFDREAFARAYADFGAQRNTRLLGLWMRLLKRDGKPQYLQHIPRTWGYLARNLRSPGLAGLQAWYDRHFPPEARAAKLPG